MKENIDATLLAELRKETAHINLFAKFNFPTVMRLTDLDIPCYLNEELYTPWDIKIGEDIKFASGMAIDECEIQVDNTDRSLSTLFLSEDLRWSRVNLYMACFNSSGVILASNEIFNAILSNYEIREKQLQITLNTEFILWQKKTLRTAQTSCPWVFKSSNECRYAGEATWCDQTYDRCLQLDNTDNFGGERFLNDLMEKEIWWGRKPK